MLDTNQEHSISDLIEKITDASRLANQEEARSALLYCLKQLKISAASNGDSDD